MKHYTKNKWNELGAVECWGRNRSSAECIRAGKTSYRRRERRQLKRMTDELVADEMDGYTDAERAYWYGEFKRARCDFRDLEYAEEYLRESGQWTADHTRIFAMAYREIRERSENAVEEWLDAA